jgi:hypothetical protein
MYSMRNRLIAAEVSRRVKDSDTNVLILNLAPENLGITNSMRKTPAIATMSSHQAMEEPNKTGGKGRLKLSRNVGRSRAMLRAPQMAIIFQSLMEPCSTPIAFLFGGFRGKRNVGKPGRLNLVVKTRSGASLFHDRDTPGPLPAD